MITLAIGQPKQPLFEDRILAAPERQRKTQDLVVVADSGQPILTPAIGAGASLIVRQVVPGVPRASDAHGRYLRNERLGRILDLP